jgi:hypothetical protein
MTGWQDMTYSMPRGRQPGLLLLHLAGRRPACCTRPGTRSSAPAARTAGRSPPAGVLIVARRPGGGICGRCYRRDPEVVEECAECGRLRNPVVRLPSGGQPDLCDRCNRGPERECSRCRRVRPCVRITTGEPICHSCYSAVVRARPSAPAAASPIR